VRALLASPLGFLIGVALGALGGGGSILAVPALVYAAGESPRAATTTSLIVVGVTALGGVVAHHRAGRVRVVAGLVFGLAGVGGSLLGSSLNGVVDDDVLLLAFAGLMLVAGWRMWVNKPCETLGDLAGPSRRRCRPVADPDPMGVLLTEAPPATLTGLDVTVAAKVLVAGTVVGLITGFFGVGGGFVVVPALVLALGFSMPEAVGTSLLVIAVNSAVAVTSRLSTTGVDWGVALPFTVAGLLGSSTGKRLGDRLPAVTLIRWFVVLLCVLAAYVATQATLALLGG
jgi:uncharacterized membrane protein YfcA